MLCGYKGPYGTSIPLLRGFLVFPRYISEFVIVIVFNTFAVMLFSLDSINFYSSYVYSLGGVAFTWLVLFTRVGGISPLFRVISVGVGYSPFFLYTSLVQSIIHSYRHGYVIRKVVGSVLFSEFVLNFVLKSLVEGSHTGCFVLS